MDRTTDAEQNADWNKRFPRHPGQTNMDRVEAVARLRELCDRIDTNDPPDAEEIERALAEYSANPPANDSTLEGAMIDIELDALEAVLKRLGTKEKENGRRNEG
ncbi:MAG TPA: hypothetical protein VKE42_09550 [Candidatus Cybelea sp.]|nr:hypothetical protein [Candidatus Cybelea sp.]